MNVNKGEVGILYRNVSKSKEMSCLCASLKGVRVLRGGWGGRDLLTCSGRVLEGIQDSVVFVGEAT